MKKLLAILVCVVIFMTTGVYAASDVPAVLYDSPENYTAAYSISIKVEDNADIRNLLHELMNTDDSMESYIMGDVLGILTALFDYNGQINVQANISGDYKKIKLAVTANEMLSSVVSANMNYKINSKAGIWADIDFSNASAPKADIILLSPMADKYYYANVGNYITAEDVNSINDFFGIAYNEQTKKELAKLLFDDSVIEKTKTGYKVSMSNNDFIGMTNKLAASMTGIPGPVLPDGIKVLGKEGMQAEYVLENGYVKSSAVTADFSMDISSIVKAIGEEWPFKASGIINVKISEKADFTKIGATTVEYPAITDTNSICLNSVIEAETQEDEYYYEDDYEMDYPWGYVSSYGEGFVNVDGGYYVPLRSVLEDAYDDTVNIGYDNGFITINCEHFTKFSTLSLSIGSDKVLVDGVESCIGEVKLIDGVTYVNTKLFTDIFGWNITSIYHELIENTYDFNFGTENY